MKYEDGQIITYYNHDIWFNGETNTWVFNLIGWVYEVETLVEAKKTIKANWRQSAYFYNHCC